MGEWRWMGVGGEIFWVNGGGGHFFGWVGVGGGGWRYNLGGWG